MSGTECANPQVCRSWLSRTHTLRRPEPLMFSISDLVPSRYLAHPTLTQSKEGCIDETSLTSEAQRDRWRFRFLNPRWCYGYAGPAVGPGSVFTVFAGSMFCTITHHLPTFAHFLLLWEHLSGFCCLLRLRSEQLHGFMFHGFRIRSQLR